MASTRSKKPIACAVAGFALAAAGSANAAPPELAVQRQGEGEVEVSVAGGGEVEDGWVLQDSFNLVDWLDISEVDGSPLRLPLGSAPTGQRFFRAAKKPLASRQEALTQARQRWETFGLGIYQFRIQSSGGRFLTDDVTLVEDRDVVETTSLLPPEFPGFSWGDGTIDSLFNRLQAAIDQDAHAMDVVYNRDLGYPETVYVDVDERIADEEWGFQITAAPADPERARVENGEKWKRAGIGSYEFDLRYHTAWFFWDGRIRVTGGEAVVVDGPAVGSHEHIVMPMDGYLDYIGAALAEGEVSSAAYDPGLGHPVFFSRDWYLTIADGPGERFWISGFRALREP